MYFTERIPVLHIHKGEILYQEIKNTDTGIQRW